jgi:L-rhamnose mutarotase
MNTRYCFACDLKNNPELIHTYETYHRSVWPEILQSIKESGIVDLQIYRIENRLFMIMEVNEQFSFEKKKIMDDQSPIVQKWETLMWEYQQALPLAKPGEKWIPCVKIFQL